LVRVKLKAVGLCSEWTALFVCDKRIERTPLLKCTAGEAERRRLLGGRGMVEIRIEARVFEKFPSFRRGIVIAKNIQNQGHSTELEAMLNGVVAEASRKPIDLKADFRIGVWSEAHKGFGSNPNKFPPAHAALIKRVQKPGTQLPLINKVVAIMNYNSIKDVIPVGGDDVDRAGECLELRFALGSETFVPLGAPGTVENPFQGEVIYVVPSSGQIMCRRWNWRNSHSTRITEETRRIVMNVDGLGEGTELRTAETRDRVAMMLQAYTGAEVTTSLLSPSQPSFRFDI
jgi:DNA/RNA-binding domain of Phe-tRNA-synthetase-like protein